MFSVITGNLKLYGLIAIGIIVAGFLAVYKYRGMKIDGLENKLKDAETHIKVAVESQRRAKTARKVEKEVSNVIKKASDEKMKTPTEINDLLQRSTIEKVSSGL